MRLSPTDTLTGTTPSPDVVRTTIEGIYSLEEWHTEARVYCPPHADGRATLKNRTIIFIIHDRM